MGSRRQFPQIGLADTKMPEAPLIPVEITAHAETVLSSLPMHERRAVHSWLDHLRNWHNDNFLRSHARPLEGQPDLYALTTSTGVQIVFQLKEDGIVVLAAFHSEDLRYFREGAGRE